MKRGALGLFLCVATAAASLLAPIGTAGRELADADGWVDLMPGKDLRGWKRVPIAPDTKLNAKNPWSVDEAHKLLLCDGVGVKEMLLQDDERKDGVFHVEWRFRKVTDRSDYNGGVYVRTSADGKIWHQAQVAHADRRPTLGDLFGETLVNGRPEKFTVAGRGEQLANPPGEWNVYEVTCKGPEITVAVNGKLATTWKDCQVLKGHVGLQAEYFFLEFRNLKYKAIE